MTARKDKPLEYVAGRMDEARTLAKGLMEITVVLHSEEEVQLAEAWKKGKQKVGTIGVRLESERPPFPAAKELEAEKPPRKRKKK